MKFGGFLGGKKMEKINVFWKDKTLSGQNG